MNSESQQVSVSSSLSSVEANVIIAGLEGVAVGWILYASWTSQDIVPTINVSWSYAAYAIYTVYAVLATVIVGFAIEGMAGIAETVVSRRWWGKERGKCWKWYAGDTDDVKNRELAQRWIWTSVQAHQDFSRRRLRILVARNTTLCLMILTLGSISSMRCSILLVMTAGSVGIALFAYLWVDARRGVRNDIANLSKIDP